MAARAAHAPTLAAVAEHLGVSRTTVSNAYNRPDQLSPALRERVLAAARRARLHGARPGGALAAARQGRIARARLRRPAALHLRRPRRGRSSSRASPPAARSRAPASRSSRSCPRARAELVRSALVDGYVMFCTPENDERLEAVRARGLPYVLVDFSPYVDGPRVEHRRPRGRARRGPAPGRPRPPADRARPALRGRCHGRRHRHRGLRPDAHRGPHALALLHPLRAPARLARPDRRRRHRLGGRAGRQLSGERRGVRLSRRGAAARPRRPPDRDHLPLRRPRLRRHARRRRARHPGPPATSASSASTTSPRPPRAPASRPSTSRTPPRARRPSACSPPAATTSCFRPTSWSAPRADPPRAEHARKEPRPCSISPSTHASPATSARSSSPPAPPHRAHDAPAAAAPRAPVRRSTVRVLRTLADRLEPAAALRAAVLSAPSAM